MYKVRMAATCFAALGVVGASAALAIDLPDPVYTYCEAEDRYGSSNDEFASIEVFSAPSQFAECLYLTGKLQKDCIWDREPKCCLVYYDKPITAFDEEGRSLGLVEELLGTSDPTGPAILDIPVLEDGTIRIGVASVFDCFDGTVNGLFSNGIHGTTGHVKVEITFDAMELRGTLDDPYTQASEVYTFDFTEGREALRLAYIAPDGAQSAHIECFENAGTMEVCYDVDYYWVQGLEARELYCITQVGGKDYHCDATDTLLGWFDKLGEIQGGAFAIGDSGSSNISEYSEICVLADEMGGIRFAVTGSGDENFNGLIDSLETDYFVFLEENEYITDDNDVEKGEGWVPGASTKENESDVVRLDRADFDDSGYASPPAHDVCGCYTFKIRLNPHEEDEGENGSTGLPLSQRADMSGDGFVDAVDLAMLLSFWGPVQ